MDKRESEAREVLAAALHQACMFQSAANLRQGKVNELTGPILAAMLAFADTRPAADLEAVKEACAKIVETIPEQVMVMWDRPGGPPGNGTRPLRRSDVATAIRSFNLSALSCAGEG